MGVPGQCKPLSLPFEQSHRNFCWSKNIFLMVKLVVEEVTQE